MSACAIAGAAAASLLALVQPAVAQETGTRLGKPAVDIPDGNMTDGDRARATLIGFSECVIKTNRKNAMAALALFPGVEGANKAFGRLADDECMGGGEMRFDASLFRGALYVVLYREKFRTFVALPPVSPDFAASAPDPMDENQKSALALLLFGDCVVRRDADNAHVAVLGPVGSAREKTAYAALAPHFSACLDSGMKVKFSKSVLGGVLAEVLYRDATQGSAAAPTGNN